MAKKKVFRLDRLSVQADAFSFFDFSRPFIFGKRRSVTRVFCQLLPQRERASHNFVAGTEMQLLESAPFCLFCSRRNKLELFRLVMRQQQQQQRQQQQQQQQQTF
jgi:alpha-D-ribose 1-methylphosphonate 5-triphosphate synthase subunit PhnG